MRIRRLGNRLSEATVWGSNNSCHRERLDRCSVFWSGLMLAGVDEENGADSSNRLIGASLYDD